MGKALTLGLGLFAVLLIAVLLYYREDSPVALFETPLTTTDGAEVFRQVCAECHGEDGQGRAGLIPPLRGKDLPLDRIKAAVQNGRGKMPAQTAVQGEALENVARYVAGLR